MRPELIVAGKELRDHLTSKRFLAIFAILMLISVYSMVTGMGNYNTNLESYKTSQQQNQQQPWYQEQVAGLQKQIQDAVDRGAAQDEIDSLQYQLDMLVNPPMPSPLFVFTDFSRYFTLIGMVLAIAIGFDLITREKEEGSLKSLLSHPVYRDAIINGKAIGAFALFAIVLAATLLITVAIMLFYGVVPKGEDLLRIGTFFALALLYCLVFFALSLMTSTIAKNSSMSVMYVLGIVVGLMMISMFSYQIVSFVMGPPPDFGGPILYESAGPVPVDDMKRVANSSAPPGDIPVVDVPALGGYPTTPPVDNGYQQYWERQQMITNAINSISPQTNFGDTIAMAVLSDSGVVVPVFKSSIAYGGYGKQSTVWDSLASVWMNILVLIIEIVIGFAVSYVMFLRADIR